MPRVFMAISLPEVLRQRLGEETDRLRLTGARVIWVDPRLYHVTLRFLGEVADPDLPELCSILDEEASGTGALQLVARGLGALPSIERPRVLTCGLAGRDPDETEALQDLRRRLNRRCRDEGFRPERGRFDPHITLGRLRGPEHTDRLAERIGPAVRREFGHFRVAEVALLESSEDRHGRIYVPLHVAALGGC